MKKVKVAGFFLFFMIFAAVLTFLVVGRFGSLNGYYFNLPNSAESHNSMSYQISGVVLSAILLVVVFGLIARWIFNKSSEEKPNFVSAPAWERGRLIKLEIDD